MSVDSILGAGFKYHVDVLNKGQVTQPALETNIMPQVGVDFIASLIRGSGASPTANWFIGVFEGNFTPTDATTASDLQNSILESVAYDEGQRPSWNNSYDGTSVISNAASRAEFTFNQDKTIFGAFVISNQTKGGTGGTLLSIARFSSPRSVESGSILRVTAGLILTPTGNL